MKKSVKLLLAALAFSILFAGCGSDGSDGKTPTVVKDVDGKCYLGYTDGTFMMANGEKIQQECPGSVSFNKTSVMFDATNQTISFGYETTGDVTHLDVGNLPMGWKAEVDVVNKQVNITSSTTWIKDDQEVYILALNNANEVKVAQMIKLEKPKPYQSTNMGTFNFIPRGTFVMGDDNSSNSAEKPAHLVTLTKGFYMATTETTQKQWETINGSLPSSITAALGKSDNHPVYFISWDDMQVFINELNKQQPNVTINGKKYKYALPTEAQWEYAARAGTTTPYFWGTATDDATLSKYAWYYGNSGRKNHPVAQLLPNLWGLYDVNGNVWELVQDYYDANWYSNPLASKDDPLNDTIRTEIVDRGGSWWNGANGMFSYGRASDTLQIVWNRVGFRLALVEE
jgi:formylglycine-generating enzyme required for sulfatase activity